MVAWLTGEPDAARVQAVLIGAESVTSSDLTLIECHRVLIRGVALGESSETEAAARRGYLTSAVVKWDVLQIGKEIVERALRPFPVEPLRSLDAIHLASALVARVAYPTLEILSLDKRIRTAANQLGFRLQPR